MPLNKKKPKPNQAQPWKCCFDNCQKDVTCVVRRNTYFDLVHYNSFTKKRGKENGENITQK